MQIISARNKQINSFPWFIDGLIDWLTDNYFTQVKLTYHAGIVTSSMLYQLDKSYLLCSHLLDSL